MRVGGISQNEKFKKTVQLLSRDLKYKGSICNIYDDTVKVGDNIAHWDYMSKCDAAAIVPILPNGKIVMVRQYRLAVDKWTIEIPAGKLDRDDDFYTCAKRELEEETGYKSDNIDFLCDIYTAAAFCDEVVRIFVATDLKEGKQHFDRDEEIVAEEWDIEDLLKEIYKGEIKDSKSVSGILAYYNKYIKNK